MILERVNLEKKLSAHRMQILNKQGTINQLEDILKHDDTVPNIARETSNQFIFDLLETENIYHIDHIRKICIDYRLRFLDLKLFKGELPEKTIQKIKNLENLHNTRISLLKIVAPSKFFRLENADDPLLFAPMGNNYFYLIDKWGNDLHPLRKLVVLPFKNLFNLTILVLLASLGITMLIPLRLFTAEPDNTVFWLLFLFVFKMVGAIVIFYGFALGKNFNYAVWDSKFYNR